MAKKQTINRASDKLAKVNDSFSVYMYDNGFMVEVSGRDNDNEYKTAKVMCSDATQLLALVQEIADMPRDD